MVKKIFYFLLILSIDSEPIFFYSDIPSLSEKLKSCQNLKKTISLKEKLKKNSSELAEFNSIHSLNQIKCSKEIFKDSSDLENFIELARIRSIQELEYFNRFVYQKELSPIDKKKSAEFFQAKYELINVLFSKILFFTLNKNFEQEIFQEELKSIYQSIFSLHIDYFETISPELKFYIQSKLYKD
jgi:hypothetical protein